MSEINSSSSVASATMADTLRLGCDALGVSLTASQLQQLMDFMALLHKWNKVYNLTAVRDPQDMLTHHLLDSLAAVPALQRHLAQCPVRPASLLDVGSGGGLPGVVFAICCPELQVSCVDTVAKKAAFVQQVAVSLHLTNLRGIHARVENLSGPFDVVSCRAFASLPDFVTWSRSALKPGEGAEPGGVWLAMKGKVPSDEMVALPADVSVFHVEPLTVPGLDAERCIVWMRPSPLLPSPSVA